MLEENKNKLSQYVAKIADEGIPNFINGIPVAAQSGRTFDNITPVDNSKICSVAYGDQGDIDRAVCVAKTAFTAWKDVPHKQRRKILHNIADEIEKNAEKIAILESYDTGQPIRFMAKAALRGAENFRYFADKTIDAQNGLSTPDTHHVNFSLKQPIGPVGVITPWNTPFMLSTWKIAPALAAGCSVVHKPAEFSPITAHILVECAHRAGLPKGVWNVVNGIGECAGKSLTEHPDIRAIAFVGETRTGSKIMSQGAATLKRLHLELGGKNPIIVFDDADIDKALDAVVFMEYSLNGERCTSGSRLLLQKTIYKEFTEKLKKRVQNLNVGHPLDPRTDIGPLIHPSHQKKVTAYIGIGQNEDKAKLAVGSKTGAVEGFEAGCYVAPTLFLDARSDMKIAREEVFGPFLTVIPFDTEEEALHMANDVAYGLAAYVWTNDIGRSQRLAKDLEVGMVWINSENVRHLPTPFGGVKYSGIGRDGGDYSFNFYMETKNIAIAYGTHNIPKMGA